MLRFIEKEEFEKYKDVGLFNYDKGWINVFIPDKDFDEIEVRKWFLTNALNEEVYYNSTIITEENPEYKARMERERIKREQEEKQLEQKIKHEAKVEYRKELNKYFLKQRHISICSNILEHLTQEKNKTTIWDHKKRSELSKKIYRIRMMLKNKHNIHAKHPGDKRDFVEQYYHYELSKVQAKLLKDQYEHYTHSFSLGSMYYGLIGGDREFIHTHGVVFHFIDEDNATLFKMRFA